MVDSAQLSKVVRDAMKGGKSALGFKETLAAVKGSRGILVTRSVPAGQSSKLREEAKKHNVPVVELTQTSAELAKLVGKPYRVSAMALRNVSDADVKQLVK